MGSVSKDTRDLRDPEALGEILLDLPEVPEAGGMSVKYDKHARVLRLVEPVEPHGSLQAEATEAFQAKMRARGVEEYVEHLPPKSHIENPESFPAPEAYDDPALPPDPPEAA